MGKDMTTEELIEGLNRVWWDAIPRYGPADDPAYAEIVRRLRDYEKLRQPY